jgi:hypothetical protein
MAGIVSLTCGVVTALGFALLANGTGSAAIRRFLQGAAFAGQAAVGLAWPLTYPRSRGVARDEGAPVR